MKIVIENSTLKTRDRIGGKLITDLFKYEDGTYITYSFYWQDEDEECVSEASGTDPQQTIKQSRKNLRKEWQEWLLWKKENPNQSEVTNLILDNSEVVTGIDNN